MPTRSLVMLSAALILSSAARPAEVPRATTPQELHSTNREPAGDLNRLMGPDRQYMADTLSLPPETVQERYTKSPARSTPECKGILKILSEHGYGLRYLDPTYTSSSPFISGPSVSQLAVK